MKSQVQDVKVILFHFQKGPHGKLLAGWGLEPAWVVAGHAAQGGACLRLPGPCRTIYSKCPLPGLVWRTRPLTVWDWVERPRFPFHAPVDHLLVLSWSQNSFFPAASICSLPDLV